MVDTFAYRYPLHIQSAKLWAGPGRGQLWSLPRPARPEQTTCEWGGLERVLRTHVCTWVVLL